MTLSALFAHMKLKAHSPFLLLLSTKYIFKDAIQKKLEELTKAEKMAKHCNDTQDALLKANLIREIHTLNKEINAKDNSELYKNIISAIKENNHHYLDVIIKLCNHIYPQNENPLGIL